MVRLFLNVKSGPESLMKIMGLARRKGIEIRTLTMNEMDSSLFNLEINYIETEKTNFISLLSSFEDVVIVN